MESLLLKPVSSVVWHSPNLLVILFQTTLANNLYICIIFARLHLRVSVMIKKILCKPGYSYKIRLQVKTVMVK